ncbi:hypothetical protein L1987_65162 [Smallanthus sonchifolius]|uniref:Uncharacterized protein n=1 Tax=Smallanthus sonchifolius TaxID=185202 RepID=A0ACB9BTN7_9ASTR|nr:hypothetical protein L1987_65162 [Smallanthus sonchifolius]
MRSPRRFPCTRNREGIHQDEVALHPWLNAEKVGFCTSVCIEALRAQCVRVVRQFFPTILLDFFLFGKLVAERALFWWNNEHTLDLIAQYRDVILPTIFEPLEKNAQGHWNQAINGLSSNVRKMFIEMDADLFDECSNQFLEKRSHRQSNARATRVELEET